MKRYTLFLALLAFAFIGCGADDDNTEAVVLTSTPTEINVTSAGGNFTLAVTCTQASWTALTSDNWITVSATGTAAKAGSVALSVAPTTDVETRVGKVTLRSGATRLEVKVTQMGREATPPSDTDEDLSSIPTPEGYRLVWHDEFNSGTELSADWRHEVKPAGWVNNERQTYVNGAVNGRRVTEIKDGCLQIHCFSEAGKIYSGRVYAKPSEGWRYGYFEARIQLPQGRGTWPAFWMMPVNFRTWPGDGEIDIMEEVGADPGQVSSTIHCNKYNNGGTAKEHGGTYFADAESAFHVYACEWTPEYIRFLMDGRAVLHYANDGTGRNAWPFDAPFYPILNLAWGGDWGGYKGVDDSALPVTLLVDYVRVFQKTTE